VLHRGQLVPHPGQQGDQHGIDDDDLVLGVVDHIGQLFGEEAQVQRVQYRAHGGDAQVGLEVGLVVPQERTHPVTVAHPDPLQGPGQSLGAVGDLGEGGLDGLAGRTGDGDHPALAIDLLAVAENATHQQRCILHGTQHDCPSPFPHRFAG
jgi:hypothetical protein